jgi:hypothetical protein
VKALDEAVGPGVLDLRLAMLNVVQGQVELIGVGLGATVLPAVVSEDGLYREGALLVEGKHVVVEHRDGAFGEFRGVQKPKA